MKIINKEQFLKLPKGTLYSEYQPCVFAGLKIKYNTISDGNEPTDYLELNLIGNVLAENSDVFDDILDEAEKTGKSFDLDFTAVQRNALFEDEQMYAVYEKKDIEQLIGILRYAFSLVNN